MGLAESPFCSFCWSCWPFPPFDDVVVDWVDDVVEFGPVKNEYTVGSPRFIAKAFNSTVGVTTTKKWSKYWVVVVWNFQNYKKNISVVLLCG